jgi:hypothetical protein
MLSAFDTAPGQQVVRHLLGHLQGHVFLRLGGGGPEMRGHDDVGQVEQRVFRRRFLLEHVEGRARDMAGFQKLGQRRLIDQTAARAVDDAHALLGLGQVLRRQDIRRLLGEGHVQRDEIGLRQKLVELDLGRPDLRARSSLRNGS